MLDLTRLENAKTRAGKTQAACPACREAGRDKAGDNLAVFDSGAFHCIVDNSEAHRRRIWELAGARNEGRGGADSHRLPPRRPATPAPPCPPPPSTKPRLLPDLHPPTFAEIRAIQEIRKWPSTAGLELLAARGLLWGGDVWDARAKHPAWIVTDSTRRVMEARRLDGKPWEGIGNAKAKTLGQKTVRSGEGWPLGLEESRPFPHIMLCEGSSDFAAALLVAWWNGCAAAVAPVALLGSVLNLPAEAAPCLAGKVVTIARHADARHTAGQDAAQRWADFARAAGASAVHILDFAQVPGIDGNLCKDLADFAQTLHMPEPEETEAAPA